MQILKCCINPKNVRKKEMMYKLKVPKDYSCYGSLTGESVINAKINWLVGEGS